jgi:hypothetical protein
MPDTNGHGSKVGAERIVLYMRVSSEEQKTKETIETQDGFLDEYCKLYGHEIARVYKDEAISGTVPMGERPAGRELLRRARSIAVARANTARPGLPWQSAASWGAGHIPAPT